MHCFDYIKQGESVLYVANASDTRAIIESNEKTERLSFDHMHSGERINWEVIIYNKLGLYQ